MRRLVCVHSITTPLASMPADGCGGSKTVLIVKRHTACSIETQPPTAVTAA